MVEWVIRRSGYDILEGNRMLTTVQVPWGVPKAQLESNLSRLCGNWIYFP